MWASCIQSLLHSLTAAPCQLHLLSQKQPRGVCCPLFRSCCFKTVALSLPVWSPFAPEHFAHSEFCLQGDKEGNFILCILKKQSNGVMCWFDINCISPPLWKEILKALFEVVIITIWTYHSKLSLSSISCIFPFTPFALFLCVLFSCITWNNQTFTVNVGPKLLMEWET